MKAPFWKMHGAGNDFVLVDDPGNAFPADRRSWLAALLARRTGIGADGLILLQRCAGADLRMRVFNPDGGEAEMCGNGARCAARLARDLGLAPAAMRIATRAGTIQAEAGDTDVLVHMPPPRGWRLRQRLSVGGADAAYSFVDTGVPHAVIEAPDLDVCDVQGLGAAVRRHAEFAPAGTNVDFYSAAGPDALRVRTYERGVEAETPACGTGIVAAALVAAALGRVRPPVRVLARGGDTLVADFRLTPDGAEAVTLRGPAAYVFRGELEYPGPAGPAAARAPEGRP